MLNVHMNRFNPLHAVQICTVPKDVCDKLYSIQVTGMPKCSESYLLLFKWNLASPIAERVQERRGHHKEEEKEEAVQAFLIII